TEARSVKVGNAASVSGPELETLLQRTIARQKLLVVAERRGYPREIVEALVAAGADRDYFAEKEKLDPLAEKLSSPTRKVTVARDEEHNRFSLRVEDRSTGYPRQYEFGFEFLSSPEYRTLLANAKDFPAITGEIVVSSTGEDAAPDVKLSSLDE